MDVRRGQHVDAARHQGDALQMIVDRDREMIAGRRILARDHEVAHQQRLALDAAQRLVDEMIGARFLRRAFGVEAQAVLLARRDPVPSFLRWTGGDKCRDKAARQARVARWPRPPARARSRRGCRSRDRSGRVRRAGRAPCRRSRSAPTVAAPRRPSRSRAISDRPGSPSRTRACSGGCRCPRCAPGTYRRPRARDASRSRPSRPSRDAARRSGWAQSA